MGKGGGSAPAAPQMSAEERELLKKQTELLTRLDTLYGESIGESKANSDILKRISGLYTVGSDGKLKLDEAAVGRQTDLAKMQLERYEKALAGKLPVSEGTLQRKSDDFKLLQENAARRGISITGDSLDNATSDSTAGAALLGQMKRSYGLLEDAERRGELAGATNPGISMLGASQASGGANLLGAGGGLLNSYSSVAQPYANQRMLEYQSAVNKFNYDQQGRAGMLGGLGQIGGALIGGFGTGTLGGALVGSRIGGGLGMLGY